MESGLIKLNPQLMSLLHNNGGQDIIPFGREIFVINVYVAGIQYCKTIAQIQDQITDTTHLTMRRQPENEVDQYAIGIYFNQTRIGWVPMKDNLVIARLMDAGKLFNCKVVSINRQDPSRPRINVSIYMVD
ncbi:MAG: HIRAN domain-containing protein [Bacteroidales bacterium]|nr:HIRAN domain-containing protein [Bacteroidales bacterium]